MMFSDHGLCLINKVLWFCYNLKLEICLLLFGDSTFNVKLMKTKDLPMTVIIAYLRTFASKQSLNSCSNFSPGCEGAQPGTMWVCLGCYSVPHTSFLGSRSRTFSLLRRRGVVEHPTQASVLHVGKSLTLISCISYKAKDREMSLLSWE